MILGLPFALMHIMQNIPGEIVSIKLSMDVSLTDIDNFIHFIIKSAFHVTSINCHYEIIFIVHFDLCHFTICLEIHVV